MSNIKIIAWNINGIRSLVKNHNLNQYLQKQKPTIFCMGETKLSCPFFELENELKKKIKGYKYRYWSPCQTRGGYSGTSIWCKKEPLSVKIGLFTAQPLFFPMVFLVCLEGSYSVS